MSKAKKVADMAIFTAIGVVLNILSFPAFGSLGRMSLVYAFCYTVGILYGPVTGFCIASISDLIPAIFFPQGAFNPLIMLGVGCMAMIVGLFMKIPRLSFGVKLTLGVIVSFFLCTLGINAGAETLFFDMYPYTFARTIGKALNIESPYLMLMLAKAIQQPFWVLLNSSIVYLALSKLRSVVNVRYDVALFDKRSNKQVME